jgi:hypothetical protein
MRYAVIFVAILTLNHIRESSGSISHFLQSNNLTPQTEKVDELFFKYARNNNTMNRSQMKIFLENFNQIIYSVTDTHKEHDHNQSKHIENHIGHNENRMKDLDSKKECLNKNIQNLESSLKSTVNKSEFNMFNTVVMAILDDCFFSVKSSMQPNLKESFIVDKKSKNIFKIIFCRNTLYIFFF